MAKVAFYSFRLSASSTFQASFPPRKDLLVISRAPCFIGTFIPPSLRLPEKQESLHTPQEIARRLLDKSEEIDLVALVFLQVFLSDKRRSTLSLSFEFKPLGCEEI
jgi:hypothetical protein